MATVVIPATPPTALERGQALLKTTPIEREDIQDLYIAGLVDAVSAAMDSGGTPLVNVREEGNAPTAAVTSVLEPHLDVDDLRFEAQVGSSQEARVGNTVTHLLEAEGESGVIVLSPRGMFQRRHVDQAAMTMRSDEVVIAPATGGRYGMLGFTETIDFNETFALPETQSIARAGVEAGYSVGIIDATPDVLTPAGLCQAVVEVGTRGAAGRPRDSELERTVESLGLSVVETEDGRHLQRD